MTIMDTTRDVLRATVLEALGLNGRLTGTDSCFGVPSVQIYRIITGSELSP